MLVSGLIQIDKQMRRERERQLNRTRLCYRTPIRSTSHLKENLPCIRFKGNFRPWNNPETGKVSQELVLCLNGLPNSGNDRRICTTHPQCELH